MLATHTPTHRPPTQDLRTDVSRIPSEYLEAEILTLAKRLAAGTYELLVLVGEADARGTWNTWGHLSCAAWLADVCEIETSTAHSQIRVARALRAFDVLDAAMGDGDISYAKARVLVPHLNPSSAEELVRIATYTPAGQLGAAIARWSQRHETPADIEARQHDARRVTWRTDADGMVTITARLAPADAAQVCAVIDHHRGRVVAPAGATLAQQRADALTTAVTNGASNDRSGAVNTEVLVHVRADGATLTDGTPLNSHAVTALLPDSFIRLLIHDTHSNPIDASPRRRYPTMRQRRVLDEKYPECDHPACKARDFLQYDHIHRYANGGSTTLDNLRRICGPHNRHRELEPDEAETTQPPMYPPQRAGRKWVG